MYTYNLVCIILKLKIILYLFLQINVCKLVLIVNYLFYQINCMFERLFYEYYYINYKYIHILYDNMVKHIIKTSINISDQIMNNM